MYNWGAFAPRNLRGEGNGVNSTELFEPANEAQKEEVELKEEDVEEEPMDEEDVDDDVGLVDHEMLVEQEEIPAVGEQTASI